MIEVKAGDRIRLIEMIDDPAPLPVGATGTVVHVVGGSIGNDPWSQLWVEWDPPNEQRSLNLLPGIDRYELVA